MGDRGAFNTNPESAPRTPTWANMMKAPMNRRNRKPDGFFASIAFKARRRFDRLQSSRDLAAHYSRSELDRAREIDTVILPLGPYRNLTTMTAALYALHPNAVALNHAAERVFGSAIDPFSDLGEDRWLNFKAGAVRLAQQGRSGDFGGSVLLSHAFGAPELTRVYQARFGTTILKPKTTALFWKDSMRLQKRITSQKGLLEDLLARQPQVRFLFPVRNPMDCARSNLQTRHARHLAPEGAGIEIVLRKILEALSWFRHYQRANPDRFFSFTELEIDPSFPGRIAQFSSLPAPASWAEEDSPKAISVVRRSAHPPELISLYSELIADLFATDPDMRLRLERLIE
jgi:hypothetical protein